MVPGEPMHVTTRNGINAGTRFPGRNSLPLSHRSQNLWHVFGATIFSSMKTLQTKSERTSQAAGLPEGRSCLDAGRSDVNHGIKVCSMATPNWDGLLRKVRLDANCLGRV